MVEKVTADQSIEPSKSTFISLSKCEMIFNIYYSTKNILLRKHLCTDKNKIK